MYIITLVRVDFGAKVGQPDISHTTQLQKVFHHRMIKIIIHFAYRACKDCTVF